MKKFIEYYYSHEGKRGVKLVTESLNWMHRHLDGFRIDLDFPLTGIGLPPSHNYITLSYRLVVPHKVREFRFTPKAGLLLVPKSLGFLLLKRCSILEEDIFKDKLLKD